MKKRTLSVIILGLLSASSVANNRFVSLVTCDKNLLLSIDGTVCAGTNGSAPSTPSTPTYTPSTEPWFIFAQGNGQLSSSSDVTGYGSYTVDFSGLGINDSNRPQKDIGHNVIYNLDFENNSLTNLDFLQNVETLISDLNFENNNITDVSGLSDLVNTNGTSSDLYLSNNSISSLVGLENISELNGLHLANNNISNLSPIQNLSFDQIKLGDNNLVDISLLNIDSKSRIIELQNNSINNISSLSGKSSLTTLDLSNNNISDFSALSSLTTVGTLKISQNPATTLSGLENLSTVSELGIQFMPNLTNIDALSGLTSSSFHIFLNGNPNLTDISGISNLTSSGIGNVYFDSPSQYTTKLNDTSPFCVAFNNGDIKVMTYTYSDLCVSSSPTPPSGSENGWVAFFNSSDNDSHAYNSSYVSTIITNESEMVSFNLEVINEDSDLPTENFPITQHDAIIIIWYPTHVNYLSSLTSASYIEIFNTVVDITGLENISVGDVYFHDSDIITTKADINSDFCLGLDSGDVWAYNNYGDLFKSDLCE